MVATTDGIKRIAALEARVTELERMLRKSVEAIEDIESRMESESELKTILQSIKRSVDEITLKLSKISK